MINGDLSRSYTISMNFEQEKDKIRTKYRNADFPTPFVNSVINQFEEKISAVSADDLIIPEFLFAEPRKFVLIEIPFCLSNERLSKRFLAKLKQFTKNKIDFAIKWSTKKVKQLFKLKSRNPHPSCKIYEGICSCSQVYIGETKRNVEVRWKEHENINKDSNPARHLREFPNHSFEWRIILNAPKNLRLRKNIESLFIASRRPKINNQLDADSLVLFKNGIT